MTLTLDTRVFSLPRNETVPLAAVAAIVTGDQTEDQFYANCIGMFPVVLAPMSEAEIRGQRNLQGWIQERGKTNERYPLTSKIYQGKVSRHYPPLPLPANSIIADVSTAPLLPSWKAIGELLYSSEAFRISFFDSFKRDAYPTGRVTGDEIHGDIEFPTAYRDRVFSIISLCADEDLKGADQLGAWTTHIHDMRKLPLKNLKELYYEQCGGHAQTIYERLCGSSKPVPSEHHIVMPTWMLHSAGGTRTHRSSSCKLTIPPQKAYVSHCVARKPLPR